MTNKDLDAIDNPLLAHLPKWPLRRHPPKLNPYRIPSIYPVHMERIGAQIIVTVMPGLVLNDPVALAIFDRRTVAIYHTKHGARACQLVLCPDSIAGRPGIVAVGHAA